MYRALFTLLLLTGCAQWSQPTPCSGEATITSLTDPVVIGQQVRAARLQRFDIEGYCPPCEECEWLVQKGMYRLAELATPAAAREAVAIALDPGMEWDGGAALLMEDAVSRLGELAVPYLLPHKDSSPIAQSILSCIEQRIPCY